MRIAFLGTPEFAVPTLAEILGAGHEVACVYTRGPKPAGRGHKERPSPVEAFACTSRLLVRTPLNFKADADREAFAALGLDAAIVVAYGLILPPAILGAPRLGCYNLHASLLPRWRGAAPIQRAIMAGDAETGACVMRLEAGLDTGPVLMCERAVIGARATAGELHDTLARLGASLMVRALGGLERGAIEAVPQSEDGVTYAHKITAEEERVDWRGSAAAIDRIIRALTPFPGAHFAATLPGGGPERIRILRAEPRPGSGRPGEVLGDEGLRVACGQGALEILEVQRAGKRALAASDFRRGFPIAAGTVLA
jgi:methionyl-tRNA formyltransferase